MTRIRYAVLLGLLSILGAGIAGGATAYATPTLTTAVAADGPTTPGELLLLLDASGSMNEKDPSGLTKIAAAKKALVSVVDDLPDTAQVGLRVYGATQTGGKPTPAACADTQLVHPITPLDKPGLTTAINRFQAKGETPIAHSIDEAVKDLGATGKRNIVLVSDGQESCVPDPCPSIRAAIGTGVDLQIDTVGFGVNATARRQLQCIADAGHGSYYDARDAQQLTTSLSKLSLRATRDFTVNGKAVTGTPTMAGAPDLQPGVYTDSLVTKATPKHYLLHRTIPGSTLRVAVSSRPTVDLESGGYNEESIRFDGLTIDGSRCTDLGGRANRVGLSSLRTIVTDAIRLDGGTASEPAKCGGDTVPLTVSRDEGNGDLSPIEILVMEEPPLASDSGLPTAAPQPTPTPEPLGTAAPVVGGSTFSDAATIGAGTWTETYLPGESIFYRIPVGWGQRLTVTVPNLAVDTDAVHVGPLFDSNLFSPDRGLAAHGSLGHTTDAGTPAMTRTIPAVTYLNRGVFPTRNSSLAGDYYLEISLPVARDTTSGLVPVRFRVDVSGAEVAAPDYVQAQSPTAAPTTSLVAAAADPPRTPTPTGTSRWPVLGGSVAVLLGGAGYAVIRRRRSSGAS